MKTVTFDFQFAGANSGNAAVNILGAHTNINFNILGSTVRQYSLDPGFYSIKVSGTSGGNLTLDITDGANALLHDTATGPHLLIIDGFQV